MVGSAFMKAVFSPRTDQGVLLAVIAGLLVGFLPLLFLQAKPVAATVRAGFKIDRWPPSTSR